MSNRIRLAISTCPNDTFAFHAILAKKIDWMGLDLEIELLDIQQLNDGLFKGKFDVAKASFHAAALLADQTVVLPSGSALGFGVGPLLLSSIENSSPLDQPESLTLCPGEHTTAAMLFQLFYGDATTQQRSRVEQELFSEIMPRLKKRSADFGVCIHEGRFTWQQEGLFCVEDLGTRWEEETECPLPLGGILARKTLDSSLVGRIQNLIRASIEYGNANRQETLETMRKHAQEFGDDVLFRHVDLYVNDWTIDLGKLGMQALNTLSQRAKDCGLVGKDCPNIEVWSANR